MEKLKLIDIIENWKETTKDFECENVNSFEEFMAKFELTGKLMLKKSENWGENTWDESLSFDFYCGPSIGHGGLSDKIYLNDYLHNICIELGIDCDLDIAENYHTFLYFITIKEADDAFSKLKSRIEQDINIDKDKY